MSNFLAVITSAFVLIYSFTSNSRMLYIWAVIKSAPAPKSYIWFEVSAWVCPISLIAPIIKILTPRSKCAVIWIPSLVFCILSTLASIPNDQPPQKLPPLLLGGVILGLYFYILVLDSEVAVHILYLSSPISAFNLPISPEESTTWVSILCPIEKA